MRRADTNTVFSVQSYPDPTVWLDTKVSEAAAAAAAWIRVPPLVKESNIDKRLTIIGIWEIEWNYDLFFCNCRLIRKLHSPDGHIPR